MKKAWETVARVLLFGILFTGCYAQTFMTKEEAVPTDKKVFFYLKDGSFIESFPDNHRRVEGGYQVSGTTRTPRLRRDVRSIHHPCRMVERVDEVFVFSSRFGGRDRCM